MLRIITSALIATSTYAATAQPSDHLIFRGNSKIKGPKKHIVLMAGDEEYRSEEALPMLAQILAKQGFNCSVLFSMDTENKFVDPFNQQSLSNSKSLDSADLILMSTRYRRYNDADMEKFEAAFERGTPIVSLRTATHAFNFDAQSKWAKYGCNAKADTGWAGGFGKQVLGETWWYHHGAHAKEGTRTVVEKSNKKHSILNGVGTIFARSDVYGASPTAPATILLRGEVTQTLNSKSPAVDGKKNTPMMPVAWTREFKQENGKVNKIFTTTMGSADDLTDENLRRLVVNSVYYGLGLAVPEKVDVTLPGTYKPTMYGFNDEGDGLRKSFIKGQTPSDFINFVSPKYSETK